MENKNDRKALIAVLVVALVAVASLTISFCVKYKDAKKDNKDTQEVENNKDNNLNNEVNDKNTQTSAFTIVPKNAKDFSLEELASLSENDIIATYESGALYENGTGKLTLVLYKDGAFSLVGGNGFSQEENSKGTYKVEGSTLTLTRTCESYFDRDQKPSCDDYSTRVSRGFTNPATENFNISEDQKTISTNNYGNGELKMPKEITLTLVNE